MLPTRSVGMASLANMKGEWRPLLPSGTYTVKYLGYETAIQFGDASKLILRLAIMDLGEWFETELRRYYTVDRLIGKAGPKGGFKVKSQTSVLITEYLNCHPGIIIPKRLDRLPMKHWGSTLYFAKVDPVTRNSRQKQLHEQQQYSKISELIGPCL
jgi:hypothetical protein